MRNSRDLSTSKVAESKDNSANTYARANLLSKFDSNGRVIGIGRRYNGDSDTPATSFFLSVFIERYDNDMYFYKEIGTGRNRNNEEILAVYR